MKRIILRVWICLYWVTRCVIVAGQRICREASADVEPYVGTVTLLKAIAALSLGVTCIGLLGCIMAVAKGV